MMDKVTVFNFKTLKKLNKKAIKYGLNRSLGSEFFDVINPDDVFPIVFSMVHNDDHIRTRFIYNDAGDSAWLDVSFADFNKLPTMAT